MAGRCPCQGPVVPGVLEGHVSPYAALPFGGGLPPLVGSGFSGPRASVFPFFRALPSPCRVVPPCRRARGVVLSAAPPSDPGPRVALLSGLRASSRAVAPRGPRFISGSRRLVGRRGRSRVPLPRWVGARGVSWPPGGRSVVPSRPGVRCGFRFLKSSFSRLGPVSCVPAWVGWSLFDFWEPLGSGTIGAALWARRCH